MLHCVDRGTLESLVVGLTSSCPARVAHRSGGSGPANAGGNHRTGQGVCRAAVHLSGDRFPHDPQAIEALQQPAKDEGVVWSDEALALILQVTQCSPYLIQQFGLQARDVADGSKEITADDVRRSIPLAMAELDDGFFRVRAGASTRNEQRYIRAMGQLGPGPVRTSDVAGALGRQPAAITPIREALLKRSPCFVPRRSTSTSPFQCSVTT